MTIFRRQRATIHVGGGPMPRVLPAEAAAAAARIAQLGQVAGAASAARAQLASVLAGAGLSVDAAALGRRLVGPDGAVLGGASRGAPVGSSGAPRGYHGGAYGGLVAPTPGGGDPLAGLMAPLTGGSGGDSPPVMFDRSFLVRDGGEPSDPATSNPARAEALAQYGVAPPARADNTLGPGPKVEPSQPPSNRGGPRASYDPDAAGGGPSPFASSWSPPRLSGGSVGDAEFGGISASRPGRLGMPLGRGFGIDDAPSRATQRAPLGPLLHGRRSIGPGGRPGA